MQATVAVFDPRTSSGSVLLDDGVRLPFEPSALRGSRLRLLRPGQRVRVETDGARVLTLQILTLHDAPEGRTPDGSGPPTSR